MIIGNWKMHKTSLEASQFISALAPKITACNASVFIAPSYTSLYSACKTAEGTNITIGSQNLNEHLEGAYTGEISTMMLKAEGVEFVLIGHSERRQRYMETDALINKKMIRALQDDLLPVLCIGETEQERKKGLTQDVLKQQIKVGLKNIPFEDGAEIIVAYEPVWAIGTGKVATAQIAQDAHSFCRKCLKDTFNAPLAKKIPILYGGSVKPDNFASLIAKEDIDGALIGGASLNVETFSKIINLC